MFHFIAWRALSGARFTFGISGGLSHGSPILQEPEQLLRGSDNPIDPATQGLFGRKLRIENDNPDTFLRNQHQVASSSQLVNKLRSLQGDIAHRACLDSEPVASPRTVQPRNPHNDALTVIEQDLETAVT